ncbi:MAG: terminase [Bacillota bacterium]|nr:MAG: terminase [Bacillota bacterium]
MARRTRRTSSRSGSAVARRRARAADPVTQYALDVVEGRVVTGRLVRLACERHLRDLDTGWQRGLRWDPDAAQHTLDFFRFLKQSKGKWDNVPLLLEPWQKFIVGSVFGWKRWDEANQAWLRRFRVAYNEIARKNGKSTLSAGVGLYMLVGDGEPGAEVYSAATKRDQAKIVWDEAAKMVRKSPALSKRIKVLPGKANMHVLANGSKYEPLGADADSLDGLNVHCAIVDELHAHKTRDLWDVLDTATGARLQPLMWAITTAGTDRESICYEQHSYAVEVLEGRIQDDTFFAYVATIDEGDDPFDERVWIKANPNLGISVQIEDLRRKAEKAKRVPTALNAFLRLHLNVWTNQTTAWLDLDLWDRNAGPVSWVALEERLRGRRCYGGLDLSSTQDMTAWVLVFPHDDDLERIDVLCRFWVPEARLTAEDNRYRDQYKAWARTGALKVTPGSAVDYDFIVKQVLEDASTFQLVDLNIDRLFQAHQVAVRLMDELGDDKVIGMGQGWKAMTAPMKELERRLILEKVHHGGHPVLRWMAGNIAVRLGPNEDMAPDKKSSQGKIDGIVALIMALDRAMRHTKAERSVYEDRGVIIL